MAVEEVDSEEGRCEEQPDAGGEDAIVAVVDGFGLSNYCQRKKKSRKCADALCSYCPIAIQSICGFDCSLT